MSREFHNSSPIAVAYYESRVDELYESPDLVITGEDPDVVDDGSDSGVDRLQDKPIRVLTDFSIFDPKHRNEMVSLVAIEQDDGLDRQFEGAGFVAPYLINEEDEGQEDGLEGELQYVRLGAILRFTLDYTGQNE
jgi:DNA (cytosine-5)-methyltransferase 1